MKVFIWESGQFTYLDMAGMVIAQAINNRGPVVGFYFDFDDPVSIVHSVIWDRGNVTAIVGPGAVNVTALDVNERAR